MHNAVSAVETIPEPSFTPVHSVTEGTMDIRETIAPEPSEPSEARQRFLEAIDLVDAVDLPLGAAEACLEAIALAGYQGMSREHLVSLAYLAKDKLSEIKQTLNDWLETQRAAQAV